MKVALLEVGSDHYHYLNKDVMGGYGMRADFGNSFLAKVLAYRKKKDVIIPVFALGYIAAIFKKTGHQVSYFRNQLPKKVDIVLIPSSIVDFKNELNWAKKVTEKIPAKVGFFGPFASTFPEIYLKVADFVIINEPEEAIEKIAQGLDPEGIIESTPIEDLDSLPFPEWQIFPWQKFSYRPVLEKKPFFVVLSSRGCVMNCNYCPYKNYYGQLSSRSPDSVIRELIYLKSNFGMRAVQFRDPIFSADRDRVLKICQLIIEEKLDLQWGCETHVNFLDRELIDVMYQAGLRSINIGIESVNKEILKSATRVSANSKKEIEVVNYCHQKGINVAAFYILGLPDDTLESMKETLAYAKSLNTLVAQFFVCTPFPKTPFYNSIKDQIFESDWQSFNSFKLVFKHKNLTRQEVYNFLQRAWVSYYFRPRYLYRYLKSIL